MTWENDYLSILRELTTAPIRETRNGAVRGLWDRQLTVDLLHEPFPLMTTKRTFWKGIVAELLMFLGGRTDTRELEVQGIKIWRGNTSREFLDRNKKENYAEGEMGPMYGYQWRNYGNTGHDQIKDLIAALKCDPMSRRHLLTVYNPIDAPKGVLYPCHSIVNQFYVSKGSNGEQLLSMIMYQRSADFFLGVPFNIASSALLLILIARETNMIPNLMSIKFGDVHLYRAHEESAEIQLKRKPRVDSKSNVIINSAAAFDSLELADIILSEYKSWPAIRAPMIA